VREYWGLNEIGRRMGVCPNTILAWHRRLSFLMMRRRKGPRWYWVTNDDLIRAWEKSRCLVDRKIELERLRRRNQASGS
jgi:hypothetical protein